MQVQLLRLLIVPSARPVSASPLSPPCHHAAV